MRPLRVALGSTQRGIATHWGIAAATVAGLCVQASAQVRENVEVTVVGTYHFGSPGLDVFNPEIDDVLKPQRQLELEALATALAEFDPTKIMLERVAKTPDVIDPCYAAFTPTDLAESRDERVQIGYRVARRLGHGTVYAIDEQHYFPFDKLVAWAKATGAQARLDALMAKGAAGAKRTEELQNQTAPAALAEMNRPEAIESDHSFYYEALGFGDTEQQPGADLNAMWYLRNAKIFAKLQRLAKAGDRVLVIYGAGHNYWLGHFARMVPGYRRVDPVLYLEKAAAALR